MGRFGNSVDGCRQGHGQLLFGYAAENVAPITSLYYGEFGVSDSMCVCAFAQKKANLDDNTRYAYCCVEFESEACSCRADMVALRHTIRTFDVGLWST